MAEYSDELPPNPKVSYLTAYHLGSPRIITDDDRDVVSRHDYLAFGDEVTETVGNVAGRTTGQGYGQDDDIRKQYTGYERDKESGLDFAQARYYNSSHGRFTSVDPLTASASITNPQSFNRYVYVYNSPYKFTDPFGLIAVDIVVTDSEGVALFVLDDGKVEVTEMTAKKLYDKGIQWFEPEADNYMPLKYVFPDITDNENLRHFSWQDIADFAEVDRRSFSFRSGGSGDWKASKKGANGYFLVTVGGNPYWADAIGQIPFAVDTFKSYLESLGDEVKAVQETLKIGQQFQDGDPFGEADTSNSYDNHFILRGTIWAAHRYDAEKRGIWGRLIKSKYKAKRSNDKHPASNLADPISRGNARRYGLKK